MSREALVRGSVGGAGLGAGVGEPGVDVVAAAAVEARRVDVEAAVREEVAHPYVADVVTVVNMTSHNKVVNTHLQRLSRGLSEGVRDRLATMITPVRVKKAFLGLNTQRWSFRFPNLKDEEAITRTARYYHAADDRLFRELYMTCADFAIQCHQHERTRVKNKLRFRRVSEEINNRKVFLVSQLLNMLYAIFDEYKTTHDKRVLVANLQQIAGFCQVIIDQCESGAAIWRSGGEHVSFPGSLQHITDLLRRSIREYERPERPSPVEATEKLITNLDYFAEGSLMLFLSHLLAKPVPMNTVYLLQKLHHIASLAQSGDPLYEVTFTKVDRDAWIKRCQTIRGVAAGSRSLMDRLVLELFGEVTATTATYNERQLMFKLLLEKDARRFDTPARNRRELEPLLAAFRSDDADEQAMLFELLCFVSTDFRDLSYAVYDFNRIPTDYREKAIQRLGLAPLKARTVTPSTTSAAALAPVSTIASIRERSKDLLADMERVVEVPVDHVNQRLRQFERWTERNKHYSIGIVKLLAQRKGLGRVLTGYSSLLNDMVMHIKQIEKVIATLRVAVSLFKDLSQADINSLSTVVHSIIQVAETAIAGIQRCLQGLSRSGEHSYVNTIIQNTMEKGKRRAETVEWHHNLVRAQCYRMSSIIVAMAGNIDELKRALARTPDDYLALRIGLFLQGASSLFGNGQLNLPPRLLALMQSQAMREVAGSEPLMSIPVSQWDEIKRLLSAVESVGLSAGEDKAVDSEPVMEPEPVTASVGASAVVAAAASIDSAGTVAAVASTPAPVQARVAAVATGVSLGVAQPSAVVTTETSAAVAAPRSRIRGPAELMAARGMFRRSATQAAVAQAAPVVTRLTARL